MSDPKFKLSKHPDGYRITRLRDNSLPMFEPELIWSVQNGWQKVDNFSKREPIDPNDPESVVAVYNPYEWKESADYYLSKIKVSVMNATPNQPVDIPDIIRKSLRFWNLTLTN